MMILEPLEVAVTLVNEKIQFSGTLRSHAPVMIDYTPPLGDGQGYTSLELLLMSLTSCIGSTVLMLLRKQQKTIAGCTVSARGIRRDTHPTSFRTITVDVCIRSNDIEDVDMQKALRLAEDSICPVWAMLKNSVEVTTTYQVLAAEGEPERA